MTDIHLIEVRDKLAIGSQSWGRYDFKVNGDRLTVSLGYYKGKNGDAWSYRLPNPDPAKRKGSGAYLRFPLGADIVSFEDATEATEKTLNDTDGTGKPKPVISVAQAVEKYRDYRRASTDRKSPLKEIRNQSSFILRTKICAIRLDKLKARDLLDWYNDELLELCATKKARARYWSFLRPALTHAAKYWPELELDPKVWIDMDLTEDPYAARDIFLNKEALDFMFQVLEDIDRLDLADFLRAMLLTGARPSEMYHVDVRHFDPKLKQIEFSHYKGQNGKKKTRYFDLTEEELAFFKRQAKGKTQYDPLMSQKDGERWTSDASKFDHIRTMANLPKKMVPAVMRHIAITRFLGDNQVDPLSVAKMCGTSVQMLQTNYAKYIRPDVVAKRESTKVL